MNASDSYVEDQNAALFAPLDLCVTHKRGFLRGTARGGHQHVFYVEFLGKKRRLQKRTEGDRLDLAEEEEAMEEHQEGIKLLTPKSRVASVQAPAAAEQAV